MRRLECGLALVCVLALAGAAQAGRLASLDHPELLDVQDGFGASELDAGISSSGVNVRAHERRSTSTSSGGSFTNMYTTMSSVTTTTTMVYTSSTMFPIGTTHTPSSSYIVYSTTIPFTTTMMNTNMVPVTNTMTSSYYANTYRGFQRSGGAHATGQAQGSQDGTRVLVQWSLYEPDVVKRRDDALTLAQSKNVGVNLRLSGASSTSVPLTEVEGCKANVAVSMNDGDSDGQARWKFGCRPGALADLGLSEAQQGAVEAVFGRGMTLKNQSAAPGAIR